MTWRVFFSVATCASSQADISQTLGDRLAGEAAKLGHLAENLLGVQSDINRVQKEVLGKVYDLSSVRTFFAAHEELVEENKVLKGEKDDLHQQIALLHQQLAAANRQVEVATGLRASSDRTAATEQGAVNGLRKDLSHCQYAVGDNERLMKINQELQTNLARAMSTSEQQLSVGRACERQNHILRKEVLEQNQYANTCHAKVQQVYEQLKRAFASRADPQMFKVLERENGILRSQVADQQHSVSTAQMKATAAVAEMTRYQADGAAAIQQAARREAALKMEIGKCTAQNMVLSTSLQEATAQRAELIRNAAELKREVSNTTRVSMSADIEVITAELNETRAALNTCTVQRAGVTTELATTRQSLAAAQAAAEANVGVAAAASEASQKLLTAARTAAPATGVSFSCSKIWETKNQDMVARVTKCDQQQKEVTEQLTQIIALEARLKQCTK